MENYLIYIDASCDLDEKVLNDNHIGFIPMQYSLGEEMRECSWIEKEDVIKLFYDGQRKGDVTQTSQITPYMYEEYFDEPMKNGHSILYFALSSGLSSTYSSACVAKQSLKEKYPNVDLFVVDTKMATCGISVQVLRAIENQKNGLSLEENFADITSMTGKTRLWFMVQDLMYLKRGGRVSATTAVFGTMLGIKPILMVDEVGKLQTINKKRGNNGALTELVNLIKGSYDESLKNNVIYICHSDAIQLAIKLKEMILKEYPQASIMISPLSPIIGAHTGPGMVLVGHYAKNDWGK